MREKAATRILHQFLRSFYIIVTICLFASSGEVFKSLLGPMLPRLYNSGARCVDPASYSIRLLLFYNGSNKSLFDVSIAYLFSLSLLPCFEQTKTTEVQ